MGWLMAVTATLLMVSAGAAETPPAGDAPNMLRRPPVTYKDRYTITVYVDKKDVETEEYTVSVWPKLLVVEGPGWGKPGFAPVGIRWILHDDYRAEWSLVAIEWDPEKVEAGLAAEGKGDDRFEADVHAPGAGVVIHLIDNFDDKQEKSEAERTYAYRVWVVNKTGMGRPISSDPAIRNDPQWKDPQ